jgi:hypothetical protein
MVEATLEVSIYESWRFFGSFRALVEPQILLKFAHVSASMRKRARMQRGDAGRQSFDRKLGIELSILRRVVMYYCVGLVKNRAHAY